MKRLQKREPNPAAIIVTGEFTFQKAFNEICRNHDIPVIVGCSERISTDLGNGEKRTEFQFQGYREVEAKPDMEMWDYIRYWANRGELREDKNRPDVFVNFSNHPSSEWSAEQRAAAEKYGKIVDVPFPDIPSSATEDQVRAIMRESLKEIVNIDGNIKGVMCQGESTAAIGAVRTLEQLDIPVFSACTERNVVINEDGSKTAKFEFKGFRKYPSNTDVILEADRRHLEYEEQLLQEIAQLCEKKLNSPEDVYAIGDELNRIEGQLRSFDNKEEFYRIKNEIGHEICKYILDNPDKEWDISFLMDDSSSNYYDKFQINGGENGPLTFLPPVMMETEERKRLLADMMLGKEVFSDTNRQGQSWNGGPAGPIFNIWANLQNGEYVNSRELKELFEEYENLKEKYGELLDMPVNPETTYTFREAMENGYITKDGQEYKGLLQCISEMQDKNEEKVQEYVNKGLSRDQAKWAESHTNAHDDFHLEMQQYAQISEEQLMEMAKKSNSEVAYLTESVRSDEGTVGVYIEGNSISESDCILLGADVDKYEEMGEAYWEAFEFADGIDKGNADFIEYNGKIVIKLEALEPDMVKELLENKVIYTTDRDAMYIMADAVSSDNSLYTMMDMKKGTARTLRQK